MWIFKALTTFITNQFFLKPAAWPAIRATRQALEALGHHPKSMDLFLGLAAPETMTLQVIFETDSELKKFRDAHQTELIVGKFRKHLSNGLFPKDAAQKAGVGFNSHEEIERGGGYRNFFN